jgi:oligoribonuclease NrnB/cAMP/cGMP phosphodiesterase (DHH superfamily)
LIDEGMPKNEKLEIYDLSYNGKEYTLKFEKKGELVSETYRYLLKSEVKPPIESISTIEKRVIYFLADEPDLTWTQAVQSSMNEELNGTKAYRYFRVYCDSIYKPAEN